MNARERQDDAGRRFVIDVAEHKMTVLRDDGLYRHLRFRHPNRSMYWFDIITSPGLLVVNGDMGSYVFSRLDDMLEFFRAGSINPQYWAEKERTGQPVQEFDEDCAKQVVLDAVEDCGLDAQERMQVIAKLKREVFSDDHFVHSDGAHSLVANFECDGFQFSDTWEWSFRAYTYQYLWTCHALRWAVRQYDSARGLAA